MSLQEKISEYARTVEARQQATHLLINFLLFANSGALLVVFTFAGVLITAGESQTLKSVPALVTFIPAASFALGVIGAGFAVFKLDRIRETYMSVAEDALNAGLEADGRLGGFQMRKTAIIYLTEFSSPAKVREDTGGERWPMRSTGSPKRLR